MANEGYVDYLKQMKKQFNRTTSIFEESDSSFAPAKELMTVAQSIAHVAWTVDWFVDGGLDDQPFDMDFEAAHRKVSAITSLAKARQMLDAAFERAQEKTAAMSESDMVQLLQPGPILGGQPRYAIYGALCDHTAHHRGALAVYARLLGKVPLMPYGE